VYEDNYVLSPAEGQLLADFLSNGGRVYMEGGDTWFKDEQTAAHTMFKIAGTENGSGDLGLLFGQEGSFTEGLLFPYDGDNNNIDRIISLDNAFELFRNQIPSYCTAVALDEGTYKTIGTSFEFGGLTDNQNTKEELMILILEFFEGILTDIDDYAKLEADIVFNAWPNPSSGSVNFNLLLNRQSVVHLQIYNLKGQHISNVTHGIYTEGLHSFSWDGSELPDGMYIYKLQLEDRFETGKIILNR
jgi:hypothetical protein